ncbi:MAG: methyltransferase domain-containing protein [Candidatus Cyclonatronum sp.]|uniref:methyltransferase domain-containing protein n=1 Tax=Cyclonatronum sp. TaxID=3024185 RepID=UPI0025C26EF3|nr:methyltransferase domain-containing protein [Cyclonatronum sp.]MCC5934954.1 methyltransferase domain-containing protein [Balneolales bacterium]MCH8487309.1 methyltransferase domain-containing protein [Cyclonatronum sp.]
MPLFLRNRDVQTAELMDSADCNPVLLNNTYRHFTHINRMLSGWELLFHRYIAPRCTDENKVYTLLDIGFGGGDIPLHMRELAFKYGIKLQITAIDTDPRALYYVNTTFRNTGISFQCASEDELLKEGQTFDFVISNHLVHHLDPEDVISLLANAKKLANEMVLFSDLSRSDIAWFLFNCLTLFSFRDSFIRYDGLTSIRRSYTVGELQELLPEGYRVEATIPFRLLITHINP